MFPKLSDYVYNEQFGRCYKFHLTPMNWTDAYAVCNAEQSYLAVINTQEEADYLVALTESKPKDRVPGNFMRGAVHLGFHNRANEGWQAVRGTALDDTGYTCWGTNQPDGGDLEQCGSMFYNGLLNDISCDTRAFFICEHEVDSLSSSLDDRFGDAVV
uniref:SFRICE_023678 n=1 Tax=Spodoptera frugiperda TaxID=7108 RepID=A0A2H1VDE2_SPOFR